MSSRDFCRIADALERIAIALERAFPLTTTITFPVLPDTGECKHVYPSPWHGIVPPNCEKCGMQAPNWIVSP